MSAAFTVTRYIQLPNCAPTLEARQVAPRREKHVLQDFLCVVLVADEAHGQAVELVFVAAQEFLEGGDVLVAGAPHQYLVGQAARADGFRLSGL